MNENNCNEHCGVDDVLFDTTELIEWLDQLKINNDCSFAFDEVITSTTNINLAELFSQTTYNYMIGAVIDNEITKLFTNIRGNKKLMDKMSTEVIYLLNISTCSLKQLYKHIYMLYICKYLAHHGGSRCNSIRNFKYSKLLTLTNSEFVASIDDKLRKSEVIDAYIGFRSDVLIKKYYNHVLSKLDKIEEHLFETDYKSVEIFMSELQSIMKHIISSNVWFIIELNNFYSSDTPIFYINNRMISYYYGDIQINYISWYLNYICPNSKNAKLQNFLEPTMRHYYENIKERVNNQTNYEVELVDI
jgi:hypothetical protein